MKPTSNKWYTRSGIAAILLCGLCCSLPLIGAFLGMGSLAIVAAYLEKIALTAGVVAMLLFWYAWYAKQKKKAACGTACDADCDCKKENQSAATPNSLQGR